LHRFDANNSLRSYFNVWSPTGEFMF